MNQNHGRVRAARNYPIYKRNDTVSSGSLWIIDHRVGSFLLYIPNEQLTGDYDYTPYSDISNVCSRVITEYCRMEMT